MNLKPMPGYMLVEVREKYKQIATTEQKYDTRSSGICLAYRFVTNNNATIEWWSKRSLEGKLVFWEEYKDGAAVERGGKKYTFVKIEDVMGYEDE